MSKFKVYLPNRKSCAGANKSCHSEILVGKQNDFVVRHPGKGTLSNVGTENYVGPVTCVGMWLGFMCAGIQTPIYGPMVGDGHQPNSRGLTYTHYKDSLLKVG